MNDAVGGESTVSAAGQLFLGTIAGAALGGALAVLVLVIIRIRGKKSPAATQLFRRTRLPLTVASLLLGVYVGFVLTQPPELLTWQQHLKHGFLILLIISSGWLVYAALGVLKDAALLTDIKTGRDVRRFRTQAGVLRRALQALTVFLTVIFVLLTFPEARAPMASLLASAGILSVVIGIAAQSSLGNMFAGLQLAFSDALRVGDTLMVPGEEQPGTVEEVTLTYVVVRTWDERRLVIPSTDFTTKPFQNWTRRASKILGIVPMQLDYSTPVAEIRAEVERLLFATDLWDKRSWAVQVREMNGPYILVGIVVSAENWAKLWDLRSYLRENVLAWIRENAPWSIPHERIITDHSDVDAQAWPTDDVFPQLLSDPTYSGLAGGGYMRKEQQTVVKKRLEDQKHKAEKGDSSKDVATKLQAQKALQQIDAQPQVGVPKVSDPEDTKQIDRAVDTPLEALPDRVDPYDHPVPTAFKQLDRGHMLFSGTPEAEERAKRYEGPGEEVMQMRERRAALRDRQGNAPLPQDVIDRGNQLPPVPEPAGAPKGDAVEPPEN